MFFVLDQRGKSRPICLVARVQNYVCYRKVTLFPRQNVLEHSGLETFGLEQHFKVKYLILKCLLVK